VEAPHDCASRVKNPARGKADGEEGAQRWRAFLLLLQAAARRPNKPKAV